MGTKHPLLAELEAARAEAGQLRQALVTRVIIEQAKGALSVTLDVSPAEAFERLRHVARSQRRNIHTVAAEVVDSRGRLPDQRNDGRAMRREG